MKKMISIFLLVFVGSVNAQVSDETDIFDVDKKKGHRILKPHIDKKLNEKIIPFVNQEVKKFKLKKEKELGMKLSDNDEEVKFARDTIRIEAYIEAYENSFSYASSTSGMNYGIAARMREYDKLLNEYYKKALSVLAPKMKNNLIESQRRWLNYYEKELDFIYELNNIGNHNTTLWCAGRWLEMLQNRVFFLRDIYMGRFDGMYTYKEGFQGM